MGQNKKNGIRLRLSSRTMKEGVHIPIGEDLGDIHYEAVDICTPPRVAFVVSHSTV